MKIFILLLLPMIVFAKTYPIVEPCALEEMQGKADKISLEKHRETILNDIKTSSGVPLVKATENATRLIDPTFTLDRDIPEVDSAGKIKRILYPAGYRFNPVDYAIVLPPPILVFNACDTNERAFAEGFVDKEPMAILVSTNCPLDEIQSVNSKQVFLLTKHLAEKFQLKHNVSIIRINREKRGIEVNEIVIK